MAKRRRTLPRLLTIKQVCRWLNCSESAVRRLVRDGHLAKPRKVAGGAARWFPEDVRVYLYRLRRGDFETKNGQKRPPRARKPDSEGG